MTVGVDVNDSGVDARQHQYGAVSFTAPVYNFAPARPKPGQGGQGLAIGLDLPPWLLLAAVAAVAYLALKKGR